MSSVALNEITDVRDGTHDTPTKLSRGIKLITSRQLKNNQILQTDYFISDEDAQKVNQRSKVDKWDILITMIGTVGDLHLVRETPDYVIKNIGLIKTAENETLAKYIFYYLQSHEGQAEIKARMSGTSQQFISLSNLRALKVNLPSPKKTQAIVDKLDVYNCLIENNSKRIEKLEAMARLLFNDWYSSFRLSHDEMKSVTELFEIKYGKTLPKTKFQADGRYPIYGGGGVIGYYNESTFDKPVCLITSRGNGSGTVWRTIEAAFITNNSFTVTTNSETKGLSAGFVQLLMETLPIKSALSGSAQPQLTIDSLSHINSPYIRYEDAKNVDAYITNIFSLIYTLFHKNKKLSQARDLLLPRLMSGEIEV